MAKYGEETNHGFTHDVFLSFRGEDTRDGFTAHLLERLKEKGIDTFFDEDTLKIGETIEPALLRGIEESKIFVIVFSKDYASSKSCLLELEKIIACTEKNKIQLAFPIFYHVNPSDVRNQINSYGESMTVHENFFGKESEKIKGWRSALSKAGKLKGQHIERGSEPKHIEEIVEKVCAQIAPKPLHVDEDLVGLKHRVEEVKSLLHLRDDDRCMLVIYGLGGVGKTELAKVLYNEIVHRFEAASFLANVRENSEKKDLEHLQKKLLSEMFEPLKKELGSTHRGISEIKRRLQKKKVLLVLDDVDNIKQLNALAGKEDWFGLGSRIIITTRDKDLLKRHQEFEKNYYYEMAVLNYQHSLQLFSQNAFKKSHPEKGYEDISARVVGYAKGLPLALKVIGSHLSTKRSLKGWQDAVGYYERTQHKEIKDVLEVSYKALDDDAQTVFLDIACLFKGERKEYVEEILKEFGAKTRIDELVDKSLLTIERGCLNMHDLLQDMGMAVVKKGTTHPGERSRLWNFDGVNEVLNEDSGSVKIVAILLDPPHREEVDWSGNAFLKMKSLRILIVRNTSFTTEPAHLPNSLRLLHWEEYPSKSFPAKFHPKKIVEFNLTKSQLTLEEESFKNFSSLTFMNFSDGQYITAMPDVSEVENLRELRLDNCKNLIRVHESIGTRKDLSHLSASGCTKLANFPQRMSLPSLEVLDLNFCEKLEQFPDISCQNEKPLEISMINTSIERLPDSIDNLTGLVSLALLHNRKLKYLPSSLLKLRNILALEFGGCSKLGESFKGLLHYLPSEANDHSTLRTLNSRNCGLSDEDLHAILICFPELEVLIAGQNNFVSLPACIIDSANLTRLDVSLCEKLREIPKCATLRILKIYHCVALEHISELPSTIEKVDARHCYSLNIETTDMLWEQVKKERGKLEIVMLQNEIPGWFDYSCERGNPCFWARRKFPTSVALSLVFEPMESKTSEMTVVEFNLDINGHCVPRKGYYNKFNWSCLPRHTFVCDLRCFFSEEEWLGLDAFLEHDDDDDDEWNLVQVSCVGESKSNEMKLSCWGVFVYREGTNMEDVRFGECPPDAKDYSSDIITIEPCETTVDNLWEHREILLEFIVDEGFNEALKEELDIRYNDPKNDLFLNEIKQEARGVLEGKSIDVRKPLYGLLKKMENCLKVPLSPIDMDAGDASNTGNHQGISLDKNMKHKMMDVFLQGIGEGLCEVRNNFPSLDVDTTMVNLVKKANNATVSFPNSEVEKYIYMEGIINGLLEARKSYPTLEVDATLDTVISSSNMPPPAPNVYQNDEITSPTSTTTMDLGEAGCSSEALQESDIVKVDLIIETFLKGTSDGLCEAQSSSPSLDVLTTMISDLDNVIMKMSQNDEIMSPTTTIMDLGEAASSSEILQEGDLVKVDLIIETFLKGTSDGLREAQTSFPSLDIETTMIDALRNVMMKMYLHGIIFGLVEASLSFPTLDTDETLITVLSKRIQSPEAPLLALELVINTNMRHIRDDCQVLFEAILKYYGYPFGHIYRQKLLNKKQS